MPPSDNTNQNVDQSISNYTGNVEVNVEIGGGEEKEEDNPKKEDAIEKRDEKQAVSFGRQDIGEESCDSFKELLGLQMQFEPMVTPQLL